MDDTEPDSITVDVVGDATHELDLETLADDSSDDCSDDSSGDPTYGDVLRAVGLSRHEATVLVDGRPVPEDATVSPGDRVEVLRLIQGG